MDFEESKQENYENFTKSDLIELIKKKDEEM